MLHSIVCLNVKELLARSRHHLNFRYNCMFLSCHIRVSEWIHTLKLAECQGTPCSKQARNLQSLKLQIWRLWTFLTFRQTPSKKFVGLENVLSSRRLERNNFLSFKTSWRRLGDIPGFEDVLEDEIFLR